MRGIALVFAGGGGKGAYQVGVWKAMREFDMDNRITAVSGASVGGLNGILFAQGDYEAAERIWLSMSDEKILTPGKKTLAQGLDELAERGLLSQAVSALKEGMFTRDGLLQIIRKELDVTRIARRQIPCYAACYNITDNVMDYFNLTGMNQRDVETILLATSALPGIFEPVRFGNCLYLDGGIRDNVPVRPLYNAGYRDFLVVHLSREGYVDEADFPGANIVQIVPSEDQGDFMTGTLDFSSEGARQRLGQGYEDGKKFFSISF
ncbi:MAG: patatin-like phospholipase family protein [Hungatella sp.]|nr:patatin-like phospholipase family protein [Hungatella sp.]